MNVVRKGRERERKLTNHIDYVDHNTVPRTLACKSVSKLWIALSGFY